MAAETPFPVSAELTAVSIRYRNPAYALIADSLLPRLPPLGLKTFKYQSFDLGQGFTVPDLQVGRRGKPHQVEFTATELSDTCLDYGLTDAIPNDDVTQAAASALIGASPPVDPRMLATEYLTDLLLLAREIRTANLVFASGTYPAANRVTLAGGSQWSDFVNSDPLGDILTGMDATQVFRPNQVAFGNAVWTKFRQHPKVVKAVYGNAGDSGIVTRQQVAALLEIPPENLLVGTSYVNTAKKGQNPSLARVWGKHVALLFNNPQASTQRGVTFGFTAQFGGRMAGSRPDPDIGLRGGEEIRVGESVLEKVVAPDTGYFIQNAVA